VPFFVVVWGFEFSPGVCRPDNRPPISRGKKADRITQINSVPQAGQGKGSGFGGGPVGYPGECGKERAADKKRPKTSSRKISHLYRHRSGGGKEQTTPQENKNQKREAATLCEMIKGCIKKRGNRVKEGGASQKEEGKKRYRSSLGGESTKALLKKKLGTGRGVFLR